VAGAVAHNRWPPSAAINARSSTPCCAPRDLQEIARSVAYRTDASTAAVDLVFDQAVDPAPTVPSP